MGPFRLLMAMAPFHLTGATALRCISTWEATEAGMATLLTVGFTVLALRLALHLALHLAPPLVRRPRLLA